MSAAPMRRSTRATVRCLTVALAGWASMIGALAQAPVNTTPSRQILEDAARTGCDATSVVVRRCAEPAADPAKVDDPLEKSRAAAKAAFDRRDRRSRDAAMEETRPGATPAAGGDAQRLETVTVTGSGSDPSPTVEQVLQRALNPSSTVSPNGTVTQYGLDGARTECIAKCYGPACCTTVRALPNPARDSNSIGR